jgi:hypothetical protein
MVEKLSVDNTTQNSSAFDAEDSSTHTKKVYGEVEMNVLGNYL